MSAKIREALKFPAADGVNVTLTWQVLPGATVAPVHVSALLAKLLGFVPPIVTVDRMRLAVPLSVTVSVRAALVVAGGWLGKLNPEAERPTTTSVPVPLKVTVCGLPLALSVKTSEALKLPVVAGVNVTLTAQVMVGATVAPVQVSALLAKSLGFVPPIAAVEMFRLLVPVLVTVTVWAVLVVLASWVKVKPGAEKLTAGAVPVPLKVTVCGLPLALSVKTSEALKLPVVAGVNVTLTAQVLPGVTVAPVQVSALLAKSLGFVPPRAAVEMLRLLVPVLVTVTVWAALVVLTG